MYFFYLLLFLALTYGSCDLSINFSALTLFTIAFTVDLVPNSCFQKVFALLPSSWCSCPSWGFWRWTMSCFRRGSRGKPFLSWPPAITCLYNNCRSLNLQSKFNGVPFVSSFDYGLYVLLFHFDAWGCIVKMSFQLVHLDLSDTRSGDASLALLASSLYHIETLQHLVRCLFFLRECFLISSNNTVIVVVLVLPFDIADIVLICNHSHEWNDNNLHYLWWYISIRYFILFLLRYILAWFDLVSFYFYSELMLPYCHTLI